VCGCSRFRFFFHHLYIHLIRYQQTKGKEGLCDACPAGQAQSDTRQDRCEQCDPGQYSSLGQAMCVECGAGSMTDTNMIGGATRCSPCQAGQYSTVSTMACDQCATGRFARAAGSSRCENCGVGQYQLAPSSTNCSQCIAGRYSEAMAATTSASCIACAVGTYQELHGQSFCKSCASGTQRNASGADSEALCVACPPGRYSGVESRACEECEVGRVQSTEGRARCDNCDTGWYQDAVGETGCKQCDHIDNLCDNAKVRQNCGGSNEGYCVDCGPGKHATAATCRECPQGYFSSQSNLPNCTRCANCTSGTRKLCGGAHVTRAFGGYCTSCVPGKHVTAMRDCRACPAGYQQAESGQESCEECEWADGRYQPEEGKTFCEVVPSGSLLAMVAREGNENDKIPTEFICPKQGVECVGVEFRYKGGVWHDAVDVAPNCTGTEASSMCTRFYTCINNGKSLRVLLQTRQTSVVHTFLPSLPPSLS
jgi:hypothetical protein